MTRAKPRWALLVSLALFLSFSDSGPRAAAAHQTPQSDDAALRALIDRFFAAYTKKNIEALSQLWSARSADLEAWRKTTQELFSTHDSLELKSLVVRKLTLDGEKGSVRVAIEMNGAEAKTGKPSALGKMNRVFGVVKEAGEWKIASEEAAEAELAAKLVAAATELERTALLGAETELMTPELWKALIALGEQARLKGDHPHALTICGLARSVAEQTGDKLGVAKALNDIGVVYYYQGGYSDAIEYFQKSLALREAIDDQAGIAASFTNLGLALTEVGDYSRALEYQQKSLVLREGLGNSLAIAGSLNNIANVYYLQGFYDLALECYKKALARLEELGSDWRTAVSLNNIGVVLMDQGNYGAALRYLQRALALRQASKDKQGIAVTTGNIGNVYYYQGNFPLALEHYRRSLALYQEMGTNAIVGRQLHNIAGVYRAEDNYTLALEYYDKSLAQRKAAGDKAGIAQTLNQMGEVYSLQGDYARALNYAQDSLALAETLGSKAGVAESLANIANINNRKGDYPEVLRAASRAAEIAGQIGLRDVFWEARTAGGRAHRALNEHSQARQAFEEAIADIESMRSQAAGGEQEQQHFLEERVSPYYAMVELLMSDNDPAEALTYAERAKARVLLDVMQSGKVNITRAMTGREQEQERKLKGEMVSLSTQISREASQAQPDQARLADLKSRLQKTRLDWEAFQTSMYAAHPDLRAQRGQSPEMKLKDAGDLLSGRECALLEYVVTEETTYLFALTRSDAADPDAVDLKAYTIPIRKRDLGGRVEAFRRKLANRDPDFRDTAVEFYDLLLGPARAQLQDKTSLVIVPDGVLWELPFQALKPAATRYLLEDGTVSYAPSLTVLREMAKLRTRQSKAGAVSLLAFGNPALGKESVQQVRAARRDEKLQPLPEAEREVRALAQLYGPAHSRVFIGTGAREDRMKAEAGKFSILHLATHGILDDANPMYSHLVLAAAGENPNEDGLLEAWEIMELDLNANLVVLSACETARGRVGAGEGMIGLSWALFVAGSPATVVSQWKVDSASTTQLMLEFHRNVKHDKSKARSLQEAALKLMHTVRYRHPFYWAGFVVVGDGF